MKIYISTEQPEFEDYTHVSNIMNLDGEVLDCEATDIIVKNLLSEFSDNETEALLVKILSKLRLNGTITIVDKDIDIIYMKYDRGDIDLQTLNAIIFNGVSKKSFLNMETVTEIIKDKIKIEQSSIDSQNGNFILKARRVANA